jgi:hypothetical protein
LGTTADAVILSIGAVKFDLETGIIEDDGFYRSVSVESNLDLGRRISEDTLIWWFKQSPEAQGVYHEEKVALDTALVELSDWIGTDDYKPWANGADFDTPMLQHAYAQLKIETPWKFWNNRCFRTYKNLPGARDVKVPFGGVKHNALADAYHQAQVACAIHAKLFTCADPVKVGRGASKTARGRA